MFKEVIQYFQNYMMMINLTNLLRLNHKILFNLWRTVSLLIRLYRMVGFMGFIVGMLILMRGISLIRKFMGLMFRINFSWLKKGNYLGKSYINLAQIYIIQQIIIMANLKHVCIYWMLVLLDFCTKVAKQKMTLNL